MLRPENVEKNINYIGYPMPVHGTEEVYEELVARLPAVHGDRRRPARDLYFTNDSVAEPRPATPRGPR